MNDVKYRYSSQYIQHDRRFRFGLWGVLDCETNEYIKRGSKGKMNTIAKLLNDPSENV